jgi:hypothetical protein
MDSTKNNLTILLLFPVLSAVFVTACTTANVHNIHVFPGESVQHAIDRAVEGDTITLHNGVYHEKVVIHKSIVLRALNAGEVTLTNRYAGRQHWQPLEKDNRTWFMEGITWPVHWMLVDGIHAFDYRSKEGFDRQECGPFWSKGWQEGKNHYPNPLVYFARDPASNKLWLKLDDDRNPNMTTIDFNSPMLDDTTYVQKDLGEYWNQQQIVRICRNPSEYPVTMWYGGTPENPSQPRYMSIPKICGIVINVRADDVIIDGLKIHLAPTVSIEINNSKNITIRDCYFSGYQYGINTGYESINLTITNCEFDGGRLISKGGHTSSFLHMWNQNTYVVPVRFNGTGLVFKHNYVYEGFDLFQPRGRHKDYAHVPDLHSEVAYNVWQQAIDNHLEFDGVEALISMRFHHNLVLGKGHNDMLAITTTEQGNPLMIDHNLFWNGGDSSRIMKLIGTGRTNDGVKFVHNTYITGSYCSVAPFGPKSVFENNIVVSACKAKDCWSTSTLGCFFPTRHNLCMNGEEYMSGFEGITGDPLFGKTPATLFSLQQGSPAIDGGIYREGYYHEVYSGNSPDLGAVESNGGVGSWRDAFGHCGPTWINSQVEALKAPNRPAWPGEIDQRWGGLN